MSYGIRISDKEDRFVSVRLPDILADIREGNKFNWSILYLYFEGDLSQGKLIPISDNDIIELEKGFFVSWEVLNLIGKNFEQIYDIILIRCKNEDLIKRYPTDEEMYEACDIVIVMFDSSYWEVFTKDKSLIERWGKKFKEVEWLIKNE